MLTSRSDLFALIFTLRCRLSQNGKNPMGRVTSLAMSYSILFILYFIWVIISVLTLNRCYSYVGRTGRKQQLSLAGGCWRHGTVAHEIDEFFSWGKFHNSFTQSDSLRHPLRSCEWAWNVRLQSTSFHSSRHFASCIISFQLVQPISFLSTATVLLHLIFGLPCFFFNQYLNIIRSDHEWDRDLKLCHESYSF